MNHKFDNKRGSVRHLGFLPFVFLFLFLVVPLSSAQTIDFTFKQGGDIELTRPCFSNGTYCSSSTTCNVTIQSPSGDVVIDNQQMTNQGAFYNLSLIGLAWDRGIYFNSMVCHDSAVGLDGSDTFFFQITPSGEADNSLQNLILLGFGFLIIIGTLSIGFSKNDPTLVLIGGIVTILLGLYVLLNGISIYRTDFTRNISMVVIFIGSYLTIRTSVDMIGG